MELTIEDTNKINDIINIKLINEKNISNDNKNIEYFNKEERYFINHEYNKILNLINKEIYSNLNENFFKNCEIEIKENLKFLYYLNQNVQFAHYEEISGNFKLYLFCQNNLIVLTPDFFKKNQELNTGIIIYNYKEIEITSLSTKEKQEKKEFYIQLRIDVKEKYNLIISILIENNNYFRQLVNYLNNKINFN